MLKVITGGVLAPELTGQGSNFVPPLGHDEGSSIHPLTVRKSSSDEVSVRRCGMKGGGSQVSQPEQYGDRKLSTLVSDLGSDAGNALTPGYQGAPRDSGLVIFLDSRD